MTEQCLCWPLLAMLRMYQRTCARAQIDINSACAYEVVKGLAREQWISSCRT